MGPSGTPRWWLPLGIGSVLGISLGAVSFTAAYDEANPESGNRSSRSTTSSRTETSSRSSDASIQTKLDEILANQKKILEEFEVVKEELRIIKIRASMQ